MSWIGEVIYGLKLDYGDAAMGGDGVTVEHRSNMSMNRDSGLQSMDVTSEYVPNAVAMPLNLRLAFLRAIGVHKAAALERGNQEFLFDKNDLDSPIKDTDCIVWQNKRLRIKSIDDYPDSYVVVARYEEPNHTPYEISLSDMLVLVDNGILAT